MINYCLQLHEEISTASVIIILANPTPTIDLHR